MRWGLCWYGQAALNRRDVGSIPTTATAALPLCLSQCVFEMEETKLLKRTVRTNRPWRRSHPAGSKAQPPTGREVEGLGRGS